MLLCVLCVCVCVCMCPCVPSLQNATHLQSMGRVEQAVSLLQKANQLRKKTHGPYHVAVLKSQVGLFVSSLNVLNAA